MDDITPLNLEDSPKLFGLRYDQLIACMISLIVSTQFYSWISPVPFCGQDLRLDVAIFFGLLGPAYCLVTMHHTTSHWEAILNFYTCPQIFIPGPDPNPTRFLTDETLPELLDMPLDDHSLENGDSVS